VNRNAVTFATDARGGFAASDIARLERLGLGLSLVLECIAWQHIAGALLEVYLGRQAGARVLAGDIKRGSGESRRAVIWVSDLRGFTRLSDRLPGERVIDILNRALEGQVAAIHAQGGEVLKFIGDGVVAIFPIADVELAPAACASALAAARAALADNAAFNRDLAASPENATLAMVAVLHVGEVFYGNIGCQDRLDFTVIGPAVNVASRLERLAKSLDRRLLVTADFVAAGRLAGLPSLGAHPLRGLTDPVEVFAPPVDDALR
jgi:adenylate cyclase